MGSVRSDAHPIAPCRGSCGVPSNAQSRPLIRLQMQRTAGPLRAICETARIRSAYCRATLVVAVDVAAAEREQRPPGSHHCPTECRTLLPWLARSPSGRTTAEGRRGDSGRGPEAGRRRSRPRRVHTGCCAKQRRPHDPRQRISGDAAGRGRYWRDHCGAIS